MYVCMYVCMYGAIIQGLKDDCAWIKALTINL